MAVAAEMEAETVVMKAEADVEVVVAAAAAAAASTTAASAAAATTSSRRVRRAICCAGGIANRWGWRKRLLARASTRLLKGRCP